MNRLTKALAAIALGAGLAGASYLVYLWGWGAFGMQVVVPALPAGHPVPSVPEPRVVTGREAHQHVLLVWAAVLAGISSLAVVPTWRGSVWPAFVAGMLFAGLAVLGVWSIGIFFAPAAGLYLIAAIANRAYRKLSA